MTAPALLCATVEVALNRYLALEPEVLQECAALEGRVIALEAQWPAWQLFVELTPSGVRVLQSWDTTADVVVRGEPGTLLRLAWQAGQGTAAIPLGLQVEGDAELLRRFSRMLARVGFDPEELAAKYLGDVAAHRLSQGLKSLLGWGQKAGNTLALDAAEYLREETRDLARASDVREWMDAVDVLREGVDRLEARLEHLEQRSEAKI